MPFVSIHETFHQNCYQWTQKGLPCKLRAGRWDEAFETESKRQRILLEDPWDDRIIPKLLDLAKHVHCRNWHRTPTRCQQYADFWIQELRRGVPRDEGYFSDEETVRRSATSRRAAAPLPQPSTASPRRHSAPTSTSSTRVNTLRSSTTQSSLRNSEPRIVNQQPTFRPMSRHAVNRIPEFIVETVERPLNVRDEESGHIYVFTRQGDPEFVKVGVSRDVDRRFRQIERDCDFRPILKYKSPLIPSVYRVEQLIFSQMHGFRYYDMRCIKEDICRRQHREWLRASPTAVIRVIRRWVTWISDAPYDDDGLLLQEWSDYLRPWLRHCHLNRLSLGPDLHFGCDIHPDTDDSDDSEEASEEEEQEEEPDCSICLEAFDRRHQATQSCRRCNHSWHSHCIDRWLETSSTCPMCRRRNTISRIP